MLWVFMLNLVGSPGPEFHKNSDSWPNNAQITDLSQNLLKYFRELHAWFSMCKRNIYLNSVYA